MSKSYDSMDRRKYMYIMRGYRLGTHLKRTIQGFWDNHVVVPKAGRFCGRPLGTEIGVTQGDPVSPTIFNIVADAVLRAVLMGFFVPHEARYGFLWVAVEHNIVLYADGGAISCHNPIWVQMAVMAVVRMFESLGLQTNLSKTKAMVCTSGIIWGKHGLAAYKQRVTG